MVLRGDPDDFDLSNSFRWGRRRAVPDLRSPLKFTTEFFGEKFMDDVVTRTGSLIADDGSVAPLSSNLPSLATFMFGATWQSQKGICWRWHRLVSKGRESKKTTASTATITSARSSAGSSASAIIRRSPDVGRAPAATLRHHHPPPVPQHTLTVDAQCNPCTVEVSGPSKVTGDRHGFDRMRGYVSVERAFRHVRESDPTEHRVGLRPTPLAPCR